jgi:hypothetical protein
MTPINLKKKKERRKGQKEEGKKGMIPSKFKRTEIKTVRYSLRSCAM